MTDRIAQRRWWAAMAVLLFTAALGGCQQEATVPRDVSVLNQQELERAATTLEPMLLRLAGIGGRVGLRLQVGTDGTVLNAHVTQTSGRQELDSAALRVGRVARFAPGTTPRSVLYTVKFPGHAAI